MLDPDMHYLLHPLACVIYVREAYIVCRTGADPISLPAASSRAAAAVVELVRAPIGGRELAARIADIPGAADVLSALGDAGAVVAGPEDRLRRLILGAVAPARVCGSIVLGVCGTSQAASVLPYAAELVAMCEQLDVVMTANATRFVQARVFEHLGIRTWTDTFEVRGDVRVPHIQLAAGADIVLVLPASASFLHRAATGACSDLLSLVVCATRAPVVVAPSMNQAMWDSPAVRRNVSQLREDGYHVVEPRASVELADWRARGGRSLALGLPLPSLGAALAGVLARGAGGP